jgi:hypothetical protein
MLTEEQQMDILIGKGLLQKRRFVDLNVTTGKTGQFLLHAPHMRKVYSAHRATNKTKLLDITSQHLTLIGQQQIRMGEGTGHYVQPGGNPERPKTVQEPAAAYGDFFEDLKKLGSDPVAKDLFLAATGRELKSTGTLTDSDAASLVLYYFNNDAKEIEDKLGKRTPLTEHLSKFSAIAGIAEQSRAFEGTDSRTGKKIPYDASLFIKQGLHAVIEGTHTLQAMFYAGPSGSQSIFLGGPTQNKEKKITGGAEQLRDPFGNPVALGRQLALFSKNKKVYKKQLNKLRIATKIAMQELSNEKIVELEKKAADERLLKAQNLTKAIQAISLPEESSGFLDFLNDRSGEIPKKKAEIKKLRKQYASDTDALAELDTAEDELTSKIGEVKKKLKI